MGTRFSLCMEMSRLTRDGTAEPISRGQILRHARGQGNTYFPCSADNEQDWQLYPVDPCSAICDGHTMFDPLPSRLSTKTTVHAVAIFHQLLSTYI